ncbi:MAG: DUF86 domain-containing protein [Heliobacteriaceae bacterium]|nr:DUF86 domain-containing protein [Heliobacteriaceae bacterium]
MVSFNGDKLAHQLGLLQVRVQKLRKMATTPEKSYLADQALQLQAERLLQTAIESVINIATHLIAAHRWPVGETYKDVMQVMADQDVVNRDLLPALVKMVRFRNLLVHVYWEIDQRQIYQILQTGVEDLAEFGREVTEFLQGTRSLQ